MLGSEKSFSVADGNVKQYSHSGKGFVSFPIKTTHALLTPPGNHAWAFSQRSENYRHTKAYTGTLVAALFRIAKKL